MNPYKKIPYGISSYKTIRQKNCYYVDKTRFIPEFESSGEFLFLIRPGRFGKSSLLTVLESYYDIARKEEFDFLFDGTFIRDHPTPEKNSHLILKFNFSQVSPDPGEVESSFHAHAKNCFFFFGEKYREFLDDKYFTMMESHPKAHQKLEFLMNYAGFKGMKVYILIDEYDFSHRAESTLFNTDMVLYFMSHFLTSRRPPDNMIDQNVRIDYGKLRHLVVPDRRLNGNFSYLSEIIGTEGAGMMPVAESFPVEYLKYSGSLLI